MFSRGMLGLALALSAAPAFAQRVTETVKDEAPLTFILTDELKARMKGPAERWDFTLIDSRARVEWEESRIPGAVSLPAENTKSELAKLVADKSRTLIFYCNGPKCTKSQKAARTAIGLGYSRVLEYNQGLPAWKEHKLAVAGKPLADFEPHALAAKDLDVARKDQAKAPVLVDVRPLDEFAKFHIPGSVHIPLDDLQARIAELPKRELVIIDHSGSQSLIAGRLFNHLGRKDVKRLGGGLQKWKEANLTLEGSEAAVTSK
jgi:rhodanese-related sulfurtransferase